MSVNNKKFDVSGLFKSDADDILKAREDSIRIHKSDIRAAGNQVEKSVLDYFTRMLPSRYHVTHGHLIDAKGLASSQLDIIISDNANIPSLITTKDGTEYIPIDSVYAIGEIKSTYRKSKNYIQGFSKVIEDIKNRLFHEEILNTAYNGIKPDTLVRDTALAKGNRILNRIFSFMLFVDGKDFSIKDIESYYSQRYKELLPNITVLLNRGMIIYGAMKDNDFSFHRYPDEFQDVDSAWFFSPALVTPVSSVEGNHLSFLYYNLVEHLSNSYLEPPTFSRFINQMKVSKSQLKKLNQQNP